jgi:uncharacterized protein Yka (UPF0111/DUF47 family)
MNVRQATLPFLCAACLLPAAISAQPRVRGGGARVEQTTNVINDCQKRASSFRRSLRRALNSSAINKTAREDQLNRDADNLSNAMDKVGDSWNRDHDMAKTRQYVSAAIVVARDIDKTMRNWHLDPDTERDWAAVKTEINALAQNFGLPRVAW